MRILQVAKKLPWPARDGESIAILHLTRGFAEAGHEVTVLAMNTPKHQFDPGFLPDKVKQWADFFAVDVDTSIRAIPAFLNLFTGASYNLERFFSPRFQEGLQQILQERTFDIIQLEGLYLAPYHKTIRRYSKAPIVMRAHNVEFAIWEKLAAREPNPLKQRYLQLLARRLRRFETQALQAYDALVPISPADEAQFRALGASRPMHTCPVGVPLTNDLSAGSKAVSAGSIGFLGALDWAANREGVDWFLDKVWPLVLHASPDATFTIAGRNAPDSWLDEMPPGVHFAGEVEDAAEFLSSQAVVVVPLLTGSGMRIKVIEALALGRPLVGSSQAVEGINLISGEHAMVADDPVVFAQEVLGLLDNPDRAESIGKAGQRLVRDVYDLENVVYALLEFYQRTFHPDVMPAS